MKRRFDLYLKDIMEAIDRLNEYTRGHDFAEFSKKKIVVDAVLRNLEIIGEAATQIQAELKEKYEQVPWRSIQDFRIVVAHHYWNVNLNRIWDILKNKLEPLKSQINDILENEGKKD